MQMLCFKFHQNRKIDEEFPLGNSVSKLHAKFANSFRKVAHLESCQTSGELSVRRRKKEERKKERRHP